jgi:small subunit ribosomal protein S1
VEIPEQVVQVGDEIFVKIIDIDLDRRRISLSLKQANEGAVSMEEEDFDPTLYGMPAEYDEQGNYKYPEGFDEQRETWERQYAEARTRFDAHRKQIEEARKAEAEAGAEPAAATGGGGETSYSGGGESESGGGALATDEALAALREKLSGGQ